MSTPPIPLKPASRSPRAMLQARHSPSRSNRARRRIFSCPPTSTGWIMRRQEDHQRIDPGQSARQQHRADRAEGFQDRQRDDRAGLRSRQARRRRQDRHRRRQCGAGRQICQGGAGETRTWQAAEPKFAMAESVRAALTLVARGEAVLGIVYSTDAKVEPGVKIVGTFPADSHPPIIYPVAATTTAKPEAADYLAFLRSSASKTILEKSGFTFPDPSDLLSACSIFRRPNGRRSSFRSGSRRWRRWWRRRSGSLWRGYWRGVTSGANRRSMR